MKNNKVYFFEFQTLDTHTKNYVHFLFLLIRYIVLTKNFMYNNFLLRKTLIHIHFNALHKCAYFCIHFLLVRNKQSFTHLKKTKRFSITLNKHTVKTLQFGFKAISDN